MDQTQLQEKIALYYQKLPEETKVLFAGMSWLETLKEIDTKYSLNDEQIKTLGTETTIMLLGIVSPDDYEITIREEIKLENNKTEEVLKEVNEKIVKEIAPLIYQSYDNNISDLINEKISKNLDERFSLLPQDVQEAIALSDWKSKLYKIANKYNLAVDKMGILEEITTQTINGDIHTSKYLDEVKIKIGISQEKINDFVSEINESIFKMIKEIMRNDKPEFISENIDIPLPPYKAAINEELPATTDVDEIPLPPQNKPSVVKTINIAIPNKDVEINAEAKNVNKNDVDLYRESGIEIISESDIPEQKNNIPSGFTLNKKSETESSPSLINNLDSLSNQKSEEIIKNVKTAAPLNIISNKLFNKTASQTTVADYSVPKMTNPSNNTMNNQVSSSVNPHDPYHEVI